MGDPRLVLKNFAGSAPLAPGAGGQGRHGAVGAGGGQLPDGLGPAVPGHEHAGSGGAAVLPGGQEAVGPRETQCRGQGRLGLLAHGLEQPVHRQLRLRAGGRIPEG